jgi:anti-anti-sigma factor
MTVALADERRSDTTGGTDLPLERTIPPFSCDLDRSGGRPRLVLEGELDLHTSQTVEVALSRLRDAGAAAIDIDLARLTFMDSAGLHLMIRWTGEGVADELSVAIVNATGQVRRVFELTGATHLLAD